MMRALAVAFGAAALALGLALGSFGAGALPTLYVNYMMNCTFTMTDDSGKPVTSPAPGTYQIAVASPVPFDGVDLSGINDMTACKGNVQFQLTGPGVNVGTTLDDGDGTYEILSATLKPSTTYVAMDMNQPGVARLSFTTLASGSPSTVQTATTAVPAAADTSANGPPLLGTLAATVGSSGKIGLTLKGKQVSTLKGGRYAVNVVDTSFKSGFVLQRAGKPATTLTGSRFVGKKSVTLNLAAGRWSFAAAAGGHKSWFVVTS
jgi:hypothetical protein